MTRSNGASIENRSTSYANDGPSKPRRRRRPLPQSRRQPLRPVPRLRLQLRQHHLLPRRRRRRRLGSGALLRRVQFPIAFRRRDDARRRRRRLQRRRPADLRPPVPAAVVAAVQDRLSVAVPEPRRRQPADGRRFVAVQQFLLSLRTGAAAAGRQRRDVFGVRLLGVRRLRLVRLPDRQLSDDARLRRRAVLRHLSVSARGLPSVNEVRLVQILKAAYYKFVKLKITFT